MLIIALSVRLFPLPSFFFLELRRISVCGPRSRPLPHERAVSLTSDVPRSRVVGGLFFSFFWDLFCSGCQLVVSSPFPFREEWLKRLEFHDFSLLYRHTTQRPPFLPSSPPPFFPRRPIRISGAIARNRRSCLLSYLFQFGIIMDSLFPPVPFSPPWSRRRPYRAHLSPLPFSPEMQDDFLFPPPWLVKTRRLRRTSPFCDDAELKSSLSFSSFFSSPKVK